MTCYENIFYDNQSHFVKKIISSEFEKSSFIVKTFAKPCNYRNKTNEFIAHGVYFISICQTAHKKSKKGKVIKETSEILSLTFNISQSYFFTASGARLPIGAKGTTDGFTL